ncbi:hypothetical protein CEXT_102031 [Caerostris extrusa]|uniref:Uncharacterized protein n=1 Tax=Caerostris extrusa TaxID=172846 RepID=A0AAV4V301_CAEEX|nr:hypothetical protein CEXT_102031 [Caerostris extrusa]
MLELTLKTSQLTPHRQNVYTIGRTGYEKAYAYDKKAGHHAITNDHGAHAAHYGVRDRNAHHNVGAYARAGHDRHGSTTSMVPSPMESVLMTMVLMADTDLPTPRWSTTPPQSPPTTTPPHQSITDTTDTRYRLTVS